MQQQFQQQVEQQKVEQQQVLQQMQQQLLHNEAANTNALAKAQAAQVEVTLPQRGLDTPRPARRLKIPSFAYVLKRNHFKTQAKLTFFSSPPLGFQRQNRSFLFKTQARITILNFRRKITIIYENP